MYIKSYLDEPYKKWNKNCGDYIIITNNFASFVDDMKEDDSNIVNQLLQLRSNYLYDFIVEDIYKTIQQIINH